MSRPIVPPAFTANLTGYAPQLSPSRRSADLDAWHADDTHTTIVTLEISERMANGVLVRINGNPTVILAVPILRATLQAIEALS